MKNKILFSTKFCHHDSSDVVGASLPQILFAEFFKKTFNFEVTLHDPFFESKQKLKYIFDEIVDDNKVNFEDYDRIINPLFYVGDLLNRNNSQKLNVEGLWGKFGKTNVKQKISDLGLIQKRSFLDDLQFRKNLFIKSYDIPYIYYYDWLKRENFK